VTLTPDTSVLVAAIAAWHPRHAEARHRLVGIEPRVERVVAHVVVETFSVLTRLPAPHRISPTDAQAALAGLPWEVVALPPAGYRGFITAAAAQGISGGAIYDGLIGVTAREHQLTVLTNDARSRRTYDALGCPSVPL